MATKVLIKHSPSGLVQKGYVGYSWTYLLFGFWVPLIRGELGVAALHVLFSFLSFGVWQVIVSFLYNRQYMTRKLTTGSILADTLSKNAYAAEKLGLKDIGTQPILA